MRISIPRVSMAVAACGVLGVISASAPDAAIAVPRATVPAVSASSSVSVPGAQSWVRRYGGGGDPLTLAAAVVVSPAGDRVFVTGESANGYATVAYSAATGAQLWAQRYHGPTSWTDNASAIAINPAGTTVFVTGTSVGTTPGDYATIAYNAATGKRLWVQRYNGPGNSYDTAFSVAVSPTGKTVFVTGGSGGIYAVDTDCVTVAYNAATGARLWVKTYDGPGGLDDSGITVAVSPTGTTVFVAGASWATGKDYDYVTLAYNAATGAQLWVRRYNGPANGNDTAYSLAVSPTGNAVFATGMSPGATSGDDYATVAYNAATGAQLWVKRYNGPGNGSDQAHSVTVSPNAKAVFVTGHSQGGPSGADYATIAYNAATGAQLWVRRYNGPVNGADAAAAVAVSPASTIVYVTGTSVGRGTDFDCVTVAYNAATGAQLWVSRYNGPVNGPDGTLAVAVSRTTGRVFVAGHSQATIGPDYVTIGYTG